MEDSKQNPGQDLSAEQVASIAGGDASCPTTVTLSNSPSVVVQSPSPAEALMSIYDGFVEVTSHVIERVINGVKQ
jgi:hypothetical protein